MRHNDCKLNYLKENFVKFSLLEFVPGECDYLCKSDCGVIWGCEVGGDQTMQDKGYSKGFCPDPKSNGRHLRILNRIRM